MPRDSRSAFRGCLAVVVLGTSLAAQVAYVDAQGREWRQLVGTTGRNWNEVAAVCPTDGVTPAAGTLGGVDLTGWVWATRAQATELLSEFAPAIAQTPFVGGAGYVLQGLNFFGSFTPLFAYYTTFGGYNAIAGWTATSDGVAADMAGVSAQYPVFYGSFAVDGSAALGTSNAQRGVWLFRQPPSAFANLGAALPGTFGFPGLVGGGAPVVGSLVTLTVAHAAPSTFGALVIGVGAANLPLFGGTLVPNPDLVLFDLPLDANGGFVFTSAWPAGLPAGLPLHFQFWCVDAAAPQGVSATNAVRVVAP